MINSFLDRPRQNDFRGVGVLLDPPLERKASSFGVSSDGREPLCGDRLRTGSGPFPWEQFVDLRVRMIGDAADDVAEPGFRIDVIKARGLDERVHDGGAPSAFV